MPFKHVFDPTKGIMLHKAPSGIPNEAATLIKGCILKNGEVQSDFGHVNYPVSSDTQSNALLGSIMQIPQFYTFAGLSFLLCFTTRQIYQYNTTNETWDVITQGTEIDDCEAAWDASAGVTSTADTDVKMRDSKSAKHVLATFSPASQPLNHYKCNDDAANTTVTDDGSGADNGTSSANTSVLNATGKINDCFNLTFDRYVNIDTAQAAAASDTVGTIAMWIKPPGTGSGAVLSYGDTDEETLLRTYYNGVDDHFYVEFKLLGSRKWYCETTDGSVSPSVWTHVAVVQNGTAPVLYVNGVADTTWIGEVDKTLWHAGLTNADNGRIGIENYDSRGEVNGFAGSVDDVRVYQTALSAADVLALYNGGAGTEGQTDVVGSEDDLQNVDISAATNTHLSFWARSSVAVAAEVFSLRLSEEATGGKGATYADYYIPALVANVWQHVSVAIASPDDDDGGTYPDDLNALASVALVANSVPGAVTIYLDDIRTTKEFTGDEDNRFSTPVYNDIQYYTNGLDKPGKITEAGGVLTHAEMTLTLPTGTLSTCEVMLPFKDHMLYFNNTENGASVPSRCSWSNIGDAEDMVAGTAGFQDLTDEESWIMAAELLSEGEVGVYKEKSIVQCVWIGGHDPFRFTTVTTNEGAMNKSCVTAAEIGGHIVLGNKTIYRYLGEQQIQPIDTPIKRDFFSIISGTYIARNFIFHLERDDEVQFWIATSTAYPDDVWCLNIEDKNYYRKTRTMTGFGFFQEQSSLTIGDLTGTIGEQNWRFGDQLTRAASPITLVGDNNGKVYKLDKTSLNNAGTAITNEFQTPDFVLPDEPEYMNKFMRIGGLIYEAAGQSVTTEWSSDGGNSWNPTQGNGENTQTLASIFNDYQQDFEATEKKIRFKFKNSIASSGFQLRYYGFPWKIRTGRR